MEAYIRITKTTNECEFRHGALLHVYNAGTTCPYIYDDDNNMHTGVSFEDLKNRIINLGGDCEIYTNTEVGTAFFKCVTADSGKFEAGKYYKIDVYKYNAGNENPFANVVDGVEILNSDFKENCEYDVSPRVMLSNIIVATGQDARFAEVSFKTYLMNTMPKLETEFKAKRYTPYVLTDEEYAAVAEEVKELLTEYDHPWTDEGVDAILEEWMENKGELLAAWKAHPAYNGNFQLVFSNETYTSNTNRNAGRDFINWVYNNYNTSAMLVPNKILGHTKKEWQKIRNYKEATMPLVTPILSGDQLELMNYELFEKTRHEIDRIAFILQLFKSDYTEESVIKKNTCEALFDYISQTKTDRISEDLAKCLNAKMPELRAREGQKITKAVGKIMRKYGVDAVEDYAKRFAAYCDAINVITVTRHTVLSLHPMDYLTMSFGNSWSSCHTIDKNNKRNKPGDNYHGAYCSGTLSYMLDKTSFVLYTADAKYTGNTFFELDKISRCMFHVENEKIVQGRCYPQSDDGNSEIYTQLRNLVQKVISEIWEIPNMWKVKRDNMDSYIYSRGTNYPDYFNYSGCNVSRFKYSDAETMDKVVHIGHDPICPSCGDEHDTEGYLHCESCD